MIHNRQTTRLPDHDYTQGAYFVTICTHDGALLFGDIVDGRMILNDNGRIAADEWQRSASIRQELSLDEWIIMPNHIHGIIIVGADGRPPQPNACPPQRARLFRPPRSLGSFIAGYKSVVTKRINEQRVQRGPVFQRNYYDRIIRDGNEWSRIREYIRLNPTQWAQDKENPHETGIH